jgi:hypothetical protein
MGFFAVLVRFVVLAFISASGVGIASATLTGKRQEMPEKMAKPFFRASLASSRRERECRI